MSSDPYWSNHEVQWETRTALLNRYFDWASDADAYAQHLAAKPTIVRVIRLEHDGPHNRTPSVKTVIKETPASIYYKKDASHA